MKNTYTLVDETNRKQLCEGRNYGVGFGFAKRKGSELTLVMPISPCKDYLNDVVFSEACGKPFKAYGLSTTKQDCFKDGKAYMVVGSFDFNHGGSYALREKEVEYLDQNMLGVSLVMHAVEEKLGIKGRTDIGKISDNRFLFIMDAEWASRTYLISLYSLIVRIVVEGRFDYKQDDAWKWLTEKASTNDCMTLKSLMAGKVKKLMKGERPEQDWNSDTFWHNCGIVGASF